MRRAFFYLVAMAIIMLLIAKLICWAITGWIPL